MTERLCVQIPQELLIFEFFVSLFELNYFSNLIMRIIQKQNYRIVDNVAISHVKARIACQPNEG